MTRFLARLSALLAERAGRVTATDPDFASVNLAAHLFAAATYLRERHGEARMDTSDLVPAIDLDETITRAAHIPSDDPVSAYLEIRGVLVGIDASFDATRLVDGPVIPEQTMLLHLSDDDGRAALHGTVRHWIRPRNPWPEARAVREVAAPWVNSYPATPGGWLETLGLLWERGELPEVTPVKCRDFALRSSPSLRIALCPLFCAGRPRFRASPDGGRFAIDQAEPYLHLEALVDHLATLAEQLEAANVQVLVLPELSVPNAAHHHIAEMLFGSRCLACVVAGSFHIWRDVHSDPYNEAALQLPHRVAWAHRKAGYFRVTARQVHHFRDFFAEPLPVLQQRVVEGIRRGSALQFWDTRIGRIAIAICADLIARENLVAAILRCSPDFVLLPSLSTETDSFERVAETLARQGISVFYVNAGCIRDLAPEALAAFVHIALPTPAGAPRSRLRWLAGACPQAFDHKTNTWSDALPAEVQVLDRDAGIVIDLGRHLSWRAIPPR